jgi:glycine/D-amino acid oxidase-like deaminating enzyme
MDQPKKVVVIGAGVVGVSAAIWLRRAGLDVVLVDRGLPGSGTSHGNAGILAASSVAPVTSPGLGWKGPQLLLDPEFPLFLRWTYLPRLAPWLRKYLGHANDFDTRRIAAGLAPLVSDAVAQHQDLTRGTKAADWVEESDYSFAYADRAAFDADKYTWSLRRDAGFVPTLREGRAVQ